MAVVRRHGHHNVELPEVRSYRVDMLGETVDGTLVHIELQSTNDPNMAFRMAEYSLAIYRVFHRMPEQVVLYFGELPMRMDARLSGPTVSSAGWSISGNLMVSGCW